MYIYIYYIKYIYAYIYNIYYMLTCNVIVIVIESKVITIELLFAITIEHFNLTKIKFH